ncbi:MAG: helix-turn-helix transcriptional regulator [Oscillospiraceae bacterium]|nr:helix-turn-helix transcriptional regulator [Oscillospiraceae bacterium]
MATEFPRMITLLRKERKISQKQAAADLGVSQALLSHYEKGIRECGLDFLVKTADYYGVTCDYLLGRSAEPRAASQKSEETAPVVPAAQKRLSDSAAVIFALAEDSGNEELSAYIERVLSLSLYRVFRTLYSANPKNDRRFFTVSEAAADGLAMAAIERSRALSEEAVRESGLSDAGITTNSLAEGHPLYVSSLLNLIKNAESYIGEIK